jgi:hypothetical protein
LFTVKTPHKTKHFAIEDPNSQPVAVAPNAIRQLPPEFLRSEITLHTVFATFAAIVILLSIFMRHDGPESVFLPGLNVPMPEICSSRRVLGVDCPGCGLTRSFIAISHGDVSRAWRLNRASIAVYLFVAIQVPWHLLQIWFLKKRGRALEFNALYSLPILIASLLLINWILKLIGI